MRPVGFRPFALMCLILVLVTALNSAEPVCSDEPSEELSKLLAERIVPEDQALTDLRRFAEKRIVPVPQPETADQWLSHASRIREETLRNVVFRGAAGGWRDADCDVKWLDEVGGGPGYRIHSLWIEVLPELRIPALLYMPEKMDGRVPVFLNVNGHDPNGKAADYKQARCIHMARNGIIALNPEWFGMGQLADAGYAHSRLNQVDLCGTSGLAPFYLAMSRSLDFLLSLENADPDRVGVAGLSGGGWQTILISSLDPRVTLCNPVAGYSGFRTRMEYGSDLGDSEQTPVDLGIHADYTVLTALLAPRPALLTYNDKDNCCFASGHALNPLVEAAAPVYRLLNAESRLRTHVNSDPGTHNFLDDNRQALYRMIRDHWYDGDESKFATVESHGAEEIRTREQLNIPMPTPNATFNSIARSLAESLPYPGTPPVKPASPEAVKSWRVNETSRLSDTVRFQESVSLVTSADVVSESRVSDMTITRWKLVVGADWTVPLIRISRSESGAPALLLHDAGSAQASERATELLNSDHDVYCFDAFYFGQLGIRERAYLWALMTSTVGERPLGIQVGQTLAVSQWIADTHKGKSVRLVTEGPRTGVIAQVAAAIRPEAFSDLQQRDAMGSLKSLLEDNRSFESSPELFCFGLLELTDIPQLRILYEAGRAGL
jgi:dienelactone hydrolase